MGAAQKGRIATPVDANFTLAVDAPHGQLPAIWAIGDVHGCCPSLDALLASPEIAGDPTCRFWFVGDLINRGAANAEVLRRVMSLSLIHI